MPPAAMVGAQTPSTGSSLITRIPSVRMIAQPPAYVPNPIATAASVTTQSGGDGKTLPLVVMTPALTRARVITPIVFCASLAPCEKETNALDTSCALRKRRFMGLGCPRRNTSSTSTVKRYASTNPISGEETSAITTGTTDPHFTAPTPYATTPIPMSAPIKACDELDGNPARQVIRFQAIAPISAAMIIPRETPCLGATSPPIVLATCVCSSSMATSAPMRLNSADSATAARGPSALVLIEVATAFAVSWKPFVKSNPSAITTVTISSTVEPLINCS